MRGHACAIKLCDFGFAVRTNGKPVRTICGTPQYMAPELATASMTSRKGYGAYEVDLWALGAMIFELLEGRPAFSGCGLAQLNERIRKASTNEFTSKTPPPAKALVKSLLRVEPTERRAAKGSLAHNWCAARVGAGNSASDSHRGGHRVKAPGRNTAVRRRREERDHATYTRRDTDAARARARARPA